MKPPSWLTIRSPAPAEPWLDRPKNRAALVTGLAILCALLFIADAFYHKHPYFALEEWFGFYAFISFLACCGLLLAAKGFQRLVGRHEDYYDR